MFGNTLGQLFGYQRSKVPLIVDPAPLQELSCPSKLSYSLMGGDGRIISPRVKAGDEIQPGDPLGADGTGQVLPSPVKGKVASVITAPDIRGARSCGAVLVEPAAETSSKVFPPLDPERDEKALLMDRIKEAGVVTNSLRPIPLREKLWPDSGEKTETLVILAADREPEVSTALRLFRDRVQDVAPAARLLSRLADAKRAVLAVPSPLAEEGTDVCAQGGLDLLSIPPEYPQSLEPLVALRAEGDEGTCVVSLECALAALDAVREGKIQDRKILTVIGPRGEAMGNYSVMIGTRLEDLFMQVGMEAKHEDKVVVGGPMRGFAQYSLDVGVDAGVDALTVIEADTIPDWSDEPCVNCGGCVNVCPVNLQVQLIGRYAEFGLFDRAEDLGLFHCIECGLCAAMCTARRPLVQLIRLAKDEIAKKKAAMKES